MKRLILISFILIHPGLATEPGRPVTPSQKQFVIKEESTSFFPERLYPKLRLDEDSDYQGGQIILAELEAINGALFIFEGSELLNQSKLNSKKLSRILGKLSKVTGAFLVFDASMRAFIAIENQDPGICPLAIYALGDGFGFSTRHTNSLFGSIESTASDTLLATHEEIKKHGPSDRPIFLDPKEVDPGIFAELLGPKARSEFRLETLLESSVDPNIIVLELPKQNEGQQKNCQLPLSNQETVSENRTIKPATETTQEAKKSSSQPPAL